MVGLLSRKPPTSIIAEKPLLRQSLVGAFRLRMSNCPGRPESSFQIIGELKQFTLVSWWFRGGNRTHLEAGSHRSEGLGVGLLEQGHCAISQWPRSAIVRGPRREQRPENSDIPMASGALEQRFSPYSRAESGRKPVPVELLIGLRGAPAGEVRWPRSPKR